MEIFGQPVTVQKEPELPLQLLHSLPLDPVLNFPEDSLPDILCLFKRSFPIHLSDPSNFQSAVPELGRWPTSALLQVCQLQSLLDIL